MVWSDKKDYSYDRYVTETVYILTDEERYGTEEAVTIKGPDDSTPVKVKDAAASFCCGKWEIGGLEVTCSVMENAIDAFGHAQVTWNGNIKATGWAAAVASDDAVIRLTGNVDVGSKQYIGVGATDRGRLEITGNVTQKSSSNAVRIEGSSTVVINGNISKPAANNYPAVYMTGGRLEMTGNITCGSAALNSYSGALRFDGEITGKTKDWYIVYIEGESAIISGTIRGPYPYKARSYGNLFINGQVSISEDRDGER